LSLLKIRKFEFIIQFEKYFFVLINIIAKSSPELIELEAARALKTASGPMLSGLPCRPASPQGVSEASKAGALKKMNYFTLIKVNTL